MKAAVPARFPLSLVVHVSTAHLGGAERSLLAALEAERVGTSRLKPFFLVPTKGPLTRELAGRGWPYAVEPWPMALAKVTQANWWRLPVVIPGMPAYLYRLFRTMGRAEEIWSSGLKSHCACLLLAPWLRGRLRIDVRDFLRPRWIRKAIAYSSRRFGARISANSSAVGADYPGSEVRYPVVRLARPVADRRNPEGPRIITHLAFFAPYKGQDLFLRYARRLLDVGMDAEFWVAGDVIYPAEAYTRYSEDVYALAARLGLASKVRFLGKIDGAGKVQDLLERTHLLLHCTRQPEPFGRVILEALLCGSEAVCHRGSGACEVTLPLRSFPGWLEPLGKVLGDDYTRVILPSPNLT